MRGVPVLFVWRPCPLGGPRRRGCGPARYRRALSPPPWCADRPIDPPPAGALVLTETTTALAPNTTPDGPTVLFCTTTRRVVDKPADYAAAWTKGERWKGRWHRTDRGLAVIEGPGHAAEARAAEFAARSPDVGSAVTSPSATARRGHVGLVAGKCGRSARPSSPRLAPTPIAGPGRRG